MSRICVQRRRGEAGFGPLGIMLLVGGVAVTWWIFMSIMDYIQAGHREKLKERYDRFASYKKKAPKPVERRVSGYQVHY